MSEKLGLKEVIAMGIGGIIGGGIFAVLGVAASLSGGAAFITYFLAGLIALASGYSYFIMTSIVKEDGGSFTFVEHVIPNKKIGGMLGWILVVGYIGTMAMYAYAFGSFTAALFGFGASSFLRGLFSVLIIFIFVIINYLGIRETGGSEDLLVYAKVAILFFFVVVGLWGIFTQPNISLFAEGLFDMGIISPIVGIGVIFVSFEGFQLLTYEYSAMEEGLKTLKRGILISIVISVIIYVFVAIVTTSVLTPAQIIQHKETVLAFAASKLFTNPLFNKISSLLISIAAIFSTSSAINATLFGTARFSYKMASENALPNIFSFRNREGVPTSSLLVISFLTAVFTFMGTLEEITTFASITFIIVFFVVNLLASRETNGYRRLIASFGVLGTFISLILLLWHLLIDKFHVLMFVGVIFLILMGFEFLYFKRDTIEEEIEEVEEEI